MRCSELLNQFECVGSVSVKRDEDGGINFQNPQERYSRSAEKDLHPDGAGPFCEFDIRTSEYEGVEGVFSFTIDENIKYVGNSSDIDKYIYDIGNISPSACYEGGQQTVCRINKKILRTVRNGRQVSLWITKSSSPQEIKKRVVQICAPAWNLR